MLDRRDDPTNALKNFHQCSAVSSIGRDIENLMFWYATLPTKSHPQEDSQVENALKHNFELLTGRFIGLDRQKATELLNADAVAGLKRAGRDDLASQWANNHDFHLFESAPVTPAHEQPAGATNEAARSVTPARPLTRHAAHGRPRLRRFARSYRMPDWRAEDIAAAPFPNGAVAPAVMPYVPYVPPSPLPVTIAPQPYREPAQVPVYVAAPLPQPSQPQAPLPQAQLPQAQLPQAQLPQAQAFAAAPPQPPFRIIASQIERNFQTIGGLIDANMRAITQAVFGQLPQR